MTTDTGRLVDHLPRQPRRQMLGDEVYESLKSLIMDGILSPGARLNIDALTRELGTSSTPVREALARLEADGLATKLAMRGYSVAPVFTASQISDLYEFRLLVEPWAAGRAAEQATDDDITRLEDELTRFSEPPEGTRHEAYKQFSEHDARLHDLILELAGNTTISQFFERTHANVHLYRVAYAKDFGVPTVDEHNAIVAAIARRDNRAAKKAMRKHLQAACDRLIAAAPDSTTSPEDLEEKQ